MNPSRAARKAFQLLTDGRVRRQALNAVDAYNKLLPAECPCCGAIAKFGSHGDTGIVGTVCPTCNSWHRHRLLALAMRRGFFEVEGKHVLNAPGAENRVWELIDGAAPASHRRIGRRAADSAGSPSLERTDLPDASIDLVVAVHSFEHVDDAKALAEVHRVLKPGGQLVAMVPLVEGWSDTFEDPGIVGALEREAYLSHDDHRRYYGRDFRERVCAAGFTLSEFTAGPEDSVRYSLERGEKVFLATK